MFFGVEGSVFSITRFLPMTVINAVAFSEYTYKFRRSSYLTVSSIHQSMLLPCSFLLFRILVPPSYVTTSP